MTNSLELAIQIHATIDRHEMQFMMHFWANFRSQDNKLLKQVYSTMKTCLHTPTTYMFTYILRGPCFNVK